jgi:hypothetical protein
MLGERPYLSSFLTAMSMLVPCCVSIFVLSRTFLVMLLGEQGVKRGPTAANVLVLYMQIIAFCRNMQEHQNKRNETTPDNNVEGAVIPNI